VAYDFGMFSTRTTNVSASSSGTSSTSTDTDTDTDKSGESDGKIKVDISKDNDTTESDGTVESSVLSSSSSDPAVSLTGIEMSKSVNYLYQSEIEYLFGGSKTSSDNLDMARNYILSFRTVVNMVSTYTISPINDAISSIRTGLMGVPVLAVGVEVALRLGITAFETYKDWEELKKGNSVVLIKTEIKDLTAYDEIANLLGENLTSSIGVESTSTSTSRKLSLNYNQYLMVLITFLRSSSVVTSRTADLVMLNVNAVKNKVGDSGTLSASDLKFSMKKAYTAVKATCSVQIDMVVMPKNFAKRMVSSSTYNEMGTVEKNSYSYTVTRGY
jgi:hypothetical protein